ncbi:MAG TPA: Maebl [Lachnospiraceae bacterium]|nr:NYN domain-containing protein [Lachnospiraceae bacterium]MBQ4241720.1 NYN domain-containing protein [Lachnospiraceae bacterium]MBQ5534867.1 NYN domain-containing protein [Lachnospiraceae bacterium]MCR4786315.1 NYN domain-containing protein [Lachnospiraceae bacterium]HBB59112.1 Maebl [Lachnospiraceae bacterium]
MAEEKRFAVLIDIENIAPKYIELIMNEASNYGNITIKRAYGDWTRQSSSTWRGKLLDYSIIPMQQFNNTFGKNSSDSALIIDAMNILYRNNVDGFILVSSDSDFTRLAATLKEEGKVVVGMGESKTPVALRNACDYFKVLDLLYKETSKTSGKKSQKKKTQSKQKQKKDSDDDIAEAAESRAEASTDLDTIERAIISIIEASGDEDNGMYIGTLGNSLIRRYPDFDTRNYGAGKLSKFLEQFDSLQLKKDGDSTYVRLL